MKLNTIITIVIGILLISAGKTEDIVNKTYDFSGISNNIKITPSTVLINKVNEQTNFGIFLGKRTAWANP